MVDDRNPSGNNAVPTDKWKADVSKTISDTLTKVGIKVSPEKLAALKTAAETSPDLTNNLDGKWLFRELSSQGLAVTDEQRESLFRLSDPEFEIEKKEGANRPQKPSKQEQKVEGANGPVSEPLSKALAQYNDPSYVPSTPIDYGKGSAPPTSALPPTQGRGQS